MRRQRLLIPFAVLTFALILLPRIFVSAAEKAKVPEGTYRFSVYEGAGTEVNFAIVNIVMACVGFWGVSNLLPRSVRAGNLRRGAPHRALNAAFVS